jgi:DNA-directed RNA polymerase subunit RPC12/RpoP
MTDSLTSPIPSTQCPRCGLRLHQVTDPILGQAPGPGDITICVECGALLRFGEGLALETRSPQVEWECRKASPRIAAMERLLDQAKREVKEGKARR